MSTALFDIPGPRARRRNLIWTIVAGLVALVPIAFVLWKLNQEGEIDSELPGELFAANNMRAIWIGLQDTLRAAGLAIVLALGFGAVCVSGRLSDRAYVRLPFVVIVEFFRAVPLILLMLVLWIGIDALGSYGAVVGGLMLYNGAVLAEVFRAGVAAVPRGQSEAAYAIGMRKSQVMRSILFPQAVRIMLPAIISQCVIVLKDTALGTIVLYSEVLDQGSNIAQFIGYRIMPFVLIAVVFIVINYSLSKLAEWIERRMSRAAKAGAEDVEQLTGAAAGA